MSRKVNEAGNALVEYALVIVLLVLVTIAVYLLVGPAIGDIISQLK